jgi:hypothetical protein
MESTGKNEKITFFILINSLIIVFTRGVLFSLARFARVRRGRKERGIYFLKNR